MLRRISFTLEKLFDQAAPPPATGEPLSPPATRDFQITASNIPLENLSYVFSQDKLSPSDLRHLFSQLSSYFEGGLLLRRETAAGTYRPVQAFRQGRELPLAELNPQPLRVPPATAFTVLKTPAAPMLRHFRLQLPEDGRLQGYAISLTSRDCLLLFSGQAEPWASLRIESLQKTLMKINFSV